MRTRSSPRRTPARITSLAAILALAFSTSGPAATPASASDDDSKRSTQPVTFRLEVPKGWTPISGVVLDKSNKPVPYTVHIENIGDAQIRIVTAEMSTDALSSGGGPGISCEAFVSPAPTYSWSNHVMFWGHKIFCNVPVPLRLRSGLWSGPNTEIYQHASSWVYNGVGLTASEDLRANCLDWGNFTYWQMLAYHEIDRGGWIPFVPYPGTHPPRWQECLDIGSVFS